MKLWSEFTHGKDDLGTAQVNLFKKGIEHFLISKRLGALLAQFHFSFDDNPKNRQRLKLISQYFPECPLIAEFRHVSWIKSDALEYIKSLGIGFCNIDQPVSRNCVSGTDFFTRDVGYIRLHGRNSDAWFKKGASVEEKYNYLYTEEELEYWIKIIKKLSVKLKELYVILNNHYQGKAVVNALQLKSRLDGHPVNSPELIVKNYPVLQKFAKIESHIQKEMFT